MRFGTREKEVHNPLTNCAYGFGLNVFAEAFEDRTSNPWYTKGFTRA